MKSELVGWHGCREGSNGAPFPSETSGTKGLPDLVQRGGGQPVIEWFHNGLKQQHIGAELRIVHRIIDI